MGEFTLLHTADLHGRLTTAAADRLRELRERHQALLLDSGDAITAPNVLLWPWREPVLARMSRAGYAAAALGNREFFFRRWGLRRKLAGADYPVLAANLRTRGGCAALSPWVALEAPGGGQVGVVGLAREMIHPGSGAERFSDLRFLPWPQAARQAAEALRGRVDLLVALSHLGMTHDLELAAQCPAYDLILGGHEHPRGPALDRVGPVTVVHSEPYLRSVTLVHAILGGPRPRLTVERVEL